MGGITQELLALLVGAIVLAQFLYERWRRRAVQARAAGGPESVPTAEPTWSPEALPAVAPEVMEELQPAPPAAARSGDQPRRFSRKALLRDRRAMQDAVVVATLLEPCLAHRGEGGMRSRPPKRVNS